MKQDSSSTGYDALRTAAAFVRRTDVGRLLVKGADRRSYLQGLLTNDIAALTPGTGCYTAMLTAQGRMITDMRVDELGDSLLLQLPAAVTGRVREHFERFVFSEDVTFEDVTASRPQIGIYGPRAAAVAEVAGKSSHAIRLPLSDDAFGIPGIEIVVDAVRAPQVDAALTAAGASVATLGDLENVRIESGVPRFGVDMDEETIPLEAGIEDRAISRTKGCYVGQEVIIRVLDRGHGRVARHFVGFAFDLDAPVPAAGALVRCGDREIGRVTSATSSPALGHAIALGYVHRDFVTPGTLVTVDGVAASVAALPFVHRVS